MKAYVINQEQLRQYIVYLVVAVVLSFVAGFYMGGALQSSDKGNKPGENLEAQAKIDKTQDEKTIAPSDEKQKPDSLIPPKSSKVDTEKSSVKSSTKTATNKTATKKSSKKEDNKKADTKKVVKKQDKPKTTVKKKTDSKKTEPPKKQVIIKDEPENTVSQQTTAKQDSSKQLEPKPVAEKSAETSSDKRMYSIQAGMFASKTNAQSFIEKLTAKNFEAYLTDFVSTSGAVKYNVRVGRFENRDKARELLREYQKSFSTPAYVVIAQ